MDDARDARATRLLRGAKFAVDRVQVPGRDGALVTREVVVHPGAVVVLPVLADGRVVMLRNHRYAVGTTLWELPAGTLEAGEDPAECAVRELEEETGYRSPRVEPLLQFYTSPGICNERMHVYVAHDCVPSGQQSLGATEKIEVELLEPARLDAMIAAGELEDGKTLVALLLWRRGAA